ncbi:hypothetical protein TrVFT333_009668 [Trichoderma virens FT-333]|nr:hypothetical protein TrVFT333_009668 [Trichoderma virens FT-333]
MPDVSNGTAFNGSNVNEVLATTSDTSSANDYGRSYSINRYLADQNHPPGYGPIQSTSEAENRAQQELSNFDAKFSSSNEPPHCS